jgi:hypothetical protein
MDVAAIQSDSFLEYVSSLRQRYSSEDSGALSANNGFVDVVSLYPSIIDPGAVWRLTESGIVQIEGEIAWGVFTATRYNGSTQVNKDVDYTMYVYESYREYIQNNFTDEKQDEHMTKLHGLIAKAMEEIAEGYSSDIGSFLEEYGFNGENDTLKQSVFAVFEERLSSKSGVSLADFDITVPESKSENLYSMDDIIALSFMREATIGANNEVMYSSAREDYPARFANYAMKKESIYNAFSISDSAKDKIETIFSKRVNDIINEWNKNAAKKSAMGYMSEELQAKFAPFDNGLILQVVNSILESMRDGLSSFDVLKKAGYLNSFFKEADKHGLQDHQSYGERNLADNFNWFLTRLGRASQVPTDSISWTKNSNWVA